MDELDQVFEQVSEYFSMLAEPSRLRILHILCDGEKSVNEVVEKLKSSQANTSRHLTAMYKSGILKKRKNANQVFYSISDAATIDLCKSVCTRIISALDDAPSADNIITQFMKE